MTYLTLSARVPCGEHKPPAPVAKEQFPVAAAPPNVTMSGGCPMHHPGSQDVSNPHLDEVNFPKLYNSPKDASSGTVTGTNVAEGNEIKISSKTTSKVWKGKVGPNVTGNVYVAAVTRKVPALESQEEETQDEKEATEDVDVTVANNSGPSNAIPITPTILPPPPPLTDPYGA